MMRLEILINRILFKNVPHLDTRLKTLGIDLKVQHRLHDTILTFIGLTKKNEKDISKLIELLDIYYPELEVLEYINE